MTTTLLRGGRIHSAFDPDATALAVTDGLITWIGGEHAVELAGSPDRVVDLAGALVVPGFVDAHVHSTDAGLTIIGLDLSGTGSLAECLAMVRRAAADQPAGVLWGHGWDETTWPENRPPTRAAIDAAVGDRPAYLARVDVHSAAVSSSLAAVVSADTAGFHPELPLSRAAHVVVRDHVRSMISAGQRKRAQTAFLEAAAAQGIVEVHECAAPDPVGRADLATLLALSSPISVLGLLGAAVSDPVEAAELIAATGAVGLAGDLSVDGAVGSRTAATSAPYADDHTTCGARYISDQQVADHLLACTRAGVQAGFHAIGDDAVRAVAAGLREAAAKLGEHGAALLAGCTPRIEHAEMPTAEDISTFAATGTVASVQPLFDGFWGGEGRMYQQRLGAQRASAMNPFAALATAGVTLALGSDAPVTPAKPWEALRAAVFHRTPGSGLSPRAALLAHTRGGHRAAGRVDRGAGTIAPGAAAHLAIVEAGELVRPASDSRVQRWSTDPRSRVPLLPDLAPGKPLPSTRATMVGGRVVFDDGLFGGTDS